jgi:hypothetical protein
MRRFTSFEVRYYPSAQERFMARYDRHFDYGMRGYRETAAARARGGRPYAYDRERTDRDLWERLPNRVTARYNADYVYGYDVGDQYDRNFNFYTGDRIERMGDERYYHRPYMTIGGTRTSRGAPRPIGYEYPYAAGYPYAGYYDQDFTRGWGP